MNPVKGIVALNVEPFCFQKGDTFVGSWDVRIQLVIEVLPCLLSVFELEVSCPKSLRRMYICHGRFVGLWIRGYLYLVALCIPMCSLTVPK